MYFHCCCCDQKKESPKTALLQYFGILSLISSLIRVENALFSVMIRPASPIWVNSFVDMNWLKAKYADQKDNFVTRQAGSNRVSREI